MEQAQLALLKSASKQDGSSNSNVHFSSLFIDRRKLSAQSEIRRRFGSNFGSTNSTSSQQNLRRRRRNKTGSASRAAKANVFVDIDDRWPTPPSRTSVKVYGWICQTRHPRFWMQIVHIFLSKGDNTQQSSMNMKLCEQHMIQIKSKTSCGKTHATLTR